MKKNIKIVTLLVLISLLCGCGKKTHIELPKLETPVAVSDSYLETEYGDICNLNILYAKVMAQKYEQSFKTNVNVKNVEVAVGDYVKAGTVLAYADVDLAKEQLAKIQKDIDYENKTYALSCNISNEKMKECQENITDCSVISENLRYDELLHERRLERLKKSEDDINSIINSSALIANHDGYVTYIKNLSSDSQIGNSEAFIEITDDTEKYLELSDVSVDEYNKYKDCSEKYILYNGEKISATDRQYTSEELVIDKAKGFYPPAMLTTDNISEMEIGENYAVYFIMEGAQNVLYVYNDSLYYDGQEFVYVKNSNGERERKNVLTGIKTEHYTEIKEGLKEGDMVYCSINTLLPSDYQEYEVSFKDFIKQNNTECYRMSDNSSYRYVSEYDGTISELGENIAKGANVNKGDLLYVINTGDGLASITEAQIALSQRKKLYENELKEYDSQIKELKNEVQTSGIEHKINILIWERELAELSGTREITDLQEKYEKVSKNNDGNGNISVYAQNSGVISSLSIRLGDEISVSDPVMRIVESSENNMLVEMKPLNSNRNLFQDTSDIGDFGETVNVELGKRKFTGKCIGQADGFDYDAFLVKMDDNTFYDTVEVTGILSFNYINMKQVIVIPTDYIHKETDIKGNKYTFVWKLINGNPVKQYISVDERYSYAKQTVVLYGLNTGDKLAID